MSAAHFQFPSACFSQTSRYFPRSLIGLPLASFIVNSYVPLTHAISPDLAEFHFGRSPSDDEVQALANMSFQQISNRLLRRCTRRVWRQDDRVIRIEADGLLDIFSCCRFRPLCIEITKKFARPVAVPLGFSEGESEGDDCEIETGSLCESSAPAREAAGDKQKDKTQCPATPKMNVANLRRLQ